MSTGMWRQNCIFNKHGDRMKRLNLAFTIVALLLCFSAPVWAHPGKTDSSGGHTNHSTGEYHYHHGQSAHQHYDMDGDGKLDCPYNYVDKSSNSGIKADNKPQNETEYQSVATKETNEKKDYSWVAVVIGYGIFFVAAFSGSAGSKKKKK